MNNKSVYLDSQVVREYSSESSLQKPEETIFETLSPQFPTTKMLDIGIGGGRTTNYFSRRVAEYIGIDYSRPMIEACKNRFIDDKEVHFIVSDATKLPFSRDNYFDLILISYNSIDYVDHDDRKQILSEVQRLLKPDGFFIFSTHNINSLPHNYCIRLTKSLTNTLKGAILYLIFILLNGSPQQIQTLDRHIVKDNAHRFRLKTYYIKPDVQVKALQDMKFKDIEVFSLRTGEQIANENIALSTDSWCYFLCRK